MPRLLTIGILASIFMLFACQTQPLARSGSKAEDATAGPTKSELTVVNGKYQIMRNGAPYFIRGAGGSGNLKLLAASGANSVRTWSTDNAQEILDNAQKNGLTVMLGLRIGHERHGFDYDDSAAIAAQKEAVRQQVMKFKDHPALLAWGIGNEVDLFYTNTNVWYAVEDIAQMIQELDPNHLVTTVTAGIDAAKANLIKERVPSIDYLSVNIYGGLEDLPQHLLDIGYSGAYVVTEWGPTGHWQVDRTDWDAPIEQISTQKAASYRSRYVSGILGAPDRALGSYAFLWGQKQETTPTWYGVFTEASQPTEVVDSLHYLWRGEWPSARAPSIKELTINGKRADESVHVQRGQHNQASLKFTSHFDKHPDFRWEILPESTDIKAGGDPEKRPQPEKGLIVGDDSRDNITFKTPQQPGAYRLFVYITDSNDKVANANIPFYVD
ncbi:DUF4434 domain-containing protein [Alteromonas pelagimontana]|uniref:DUF4434 domain-containing protein n=1 Tax=Alteromonas pelagimontana TaxID=1858656 RepID=A0A6M4M9V1_9ALTE|nr:glycoside hydrolase family 2 TIM barrel-domain containing protein [Alteromonas pelagimontana]QJR79749.1 DUF4434 domain-containing protein [Alteromonas pelagimontana]